MHFPLIPLVGFLASPGGDVVNQLVAWVVFTCAAIFGLIILSANSTGRNSYQKKNAVVGWLLILSAVLGLILGMYLLLAVISGFVFWYLGYKFLIKIIIWRVLIKNFLAIFRKNPKAKEPTTYHDRPGEGISRG